MKLIGSPRLIIQKMKVKSFSSFENLRNYSKTITICSNDGLTDDNSHFNQSRLNNPYQKYLMNP